MSTRARAAHVALLRGINVGGKNMLPMKALAELFRAAGCDEVTTYIQSGNVVFLADARTVRGLADEVAERIRARFELTVPVVVRSAVELSAVTARNPFLAGGVDPASLHVAFLAAAPARGRAAALDPERSPGDAFVLRGREVYLHLPNGTARSKLTNAYLDTTLRTTSTIRNWRTVQKLLDLAQAPG